MPLIVKVDASWQRLSRTGTSPDGNKQCHWPCVSPLKQQQREPHHTSGGFIATRRWNIPANSTARNHLTLAPVSIALACLHPSVAVPPFRPSPSKQKQTNKSITHSYRPLEEYPSRWRPQTPLIPPCKSKSQSSPTYPPPLLAP